MNNLFSSFDPTDPKTAGLLQLGLSLMQAKKDKSFLANAGQAGMQGLLGMTAAQQAQTQKKLYESQIAENESQMQQKIAALEKQRSLQDMLARFTGGQQSATGALQQGAEMGSVGPTMNNAALMNNAAPGGGRMPNLMEAMQLKIAGGPDLREYLKDAQTGYKQDAGNYYTNPMTGEKMFMPALDKGMTMGVNGQAMAVPGFGEAQAGIEGLKAGAVARAQELAKFPFDTQREINKAGLDTVQVPGAVAGQQGFTTRLNLAQGAGTVPNNSISGPPFLKSLPPTPAGWQGINQQYGENAQGRDNERVSLIQQELATEKNPANRQALINELKNMTGAQNQQGVASQGGVQQFGQPSAVAKAGEALNDNWIKSSFNKVQESGSAANKVLADVSTARGALTGLSGSGWGTQTKAGAASILVGLGIDSDKAKNYASNAQIFQQAAQSRLKEQLMMNSGPQTEGDAQREAKTFAALGNTSRANEYILDRTQAQAELDRMKAKFYQKALPHAQAKGDLQEVDRAWSERAPSVFTMPIMKKWEAYAK